MFHALFSYYIIDFDCFLERGVETMEAQKHSSNATGMHNIFHRVNVPCFNALCSNLWNAVTALSQLKLFVYSHFFYDNANLLYAVATT